MGLGISLAAPLIVYGAIFNVALGLAARAAPAIQVFFITQPLNLLLGLSLLAMVLGTLLNAFAAAMTAFMQNGWSF
jgi:flagellar biosynthetic protein FliR